MRDTPVSVTGKRTMREAARTSHVHSEDPMLEPRAAVAGVLSPHHRGEQIITSEDSRNVNSLLVSLLNPHSIEAERYRRLRHEVESLRPEGESVVIAMTSAIAGDGKSLTSVNLAGALAQDRAARVLLIELDLRHPYNNVKDYFGIRQLSGAGVVDKVLNQGARWESCVYYVTEYNLYVMPSGRHTAAPYEILKSAGLGEVLQEARERYDYVIVDTPPVVLLPDSQLIAKWVDGFMLVVGADHTPRRMLEEALNLMDPGKTLGIVFNGYSPVSDKYYSGYY